DSEVLLHGCMEWGCQVLPRLVGMFAFALLDAEDRTLFLARDPFGIKPLYYARLPGGPVPFAFASEIKALLELPGVSRRVNPQRLYDYLHHGWTDAGDETFFSAVHQLPAAHYLQISLDQPTAERPVRYWQANLDEPLDLGFDEAAGRLRE